MSLWMKSLSVTIQMKVIEQYFSVVLFIILCKGVTFSDNKRWINIVAKKNANAIYRTRFRAYGTFVFYGDFLKNLTDSLSFFLCLERSVWMIISAGLRDSMLVIFSNHLQALKREKGHH